MRDPVVVLKFGSSVLADIEALPRAVLEIYRELRRGRRVVAVVSALGATTDTLLAQAKGRFEAPEPGCLARLLETGETTAAAMLGMALDEAGVPARVLDAAQVGLRTTGGVLDAQPRRLDVRRLQTTLAGCPVAVVPGFAGRSSAGAPTLLGRGGSDLTALFVSRELAAVECRLLKDVDGLLRVLPDGGLDHGTRYATASYADCLEVGGPLIQPKAVEFARRHGLEFHIARCSSAGGTRAGALPTGFEPVARRPHRSRVALAGLGTVGLGVFRWLRTLHEDLEIVGILVADPARGRPADVPRTLLCGNVGTLLARRPDIVVEVAGGTSTAAELLERAQGAGLPVVSANKQLLASGAARRAAVGNPERLLASASVGGSLPALERVSLEASDEPVIAVEGIVNGTCNHVLDRLHAGDTYTDALEAARQRGLAEQDPHLDLSGWDSAYKLSLLCSAAFGADVDPSCIGRDEMAPGVVADVAAARVGGRELRQVVRARRVGGAVEAEVRLVAVGRDAVLAGCAGVANRLAITTASGRCTIIDGMGAGRWPTTVAVLSDVLEMRRRHLASPIRSGAARSA